MSVVWADSFDHYGTDSVGSVNALKGAYAQFLAADGPVSTRARTGAYSVVMNTSSNVVRKTYPELLTSAGYGYGLYMQELPASSNRLIWSCFADSSNNPIVSLVINTDGTVSAYKGSFEGSLIGTSVAQLAASTWNHVEAKVVVSTTIGSIEVRLNGETIYVATDLNLGANPVAQVRLHSTVSAPLIGNNTYVDDFVMWDTEGTINNDFLGPVRVYTVFPDSTLSPTDWTPTGAATVSGAIDDPVPDGDDSYASAGDSGDIFRVVLPTLPSDIGLVNAVQVNNMSRISEAGSAVIQVSVESGVDVDSGDEHILTTAYSYRSDVFQANPDGDVPWTRSTVQNAVIKVEKVI